MSAHRQPFQDHDRGNGRSTSRRLRQPGEGRARIAVISKLRSIYREITSAPAGKRFHRYHQRRKGRAGRWRIVVYGGTGLLLVILGFLLSLPPLMPGFLLWLPGLALIASQFGYVARALDHGECIMRKVYRRIRGHSGA